MRSRSTVDAGCAKLEESLKLWDRGDTVLNLALCHRLQGKTATAWAEFDRAITHGIKVRFPEAIVEAQKQRDELAAALSRLTVAVPPAIAALDGLAVEVEGQPWPRERWNTAVAMDPGRLRVHAQATGRRPFEAQVELGSKKDMKTVTVVLELEPPAPPPLPPPPPPSVAKASRPLWPWIVGGAGLALGGAALGSEVVSLSAHKTLDTKCGADRQSCPKTYDFSAARTREVLGFGLFLGLGAGSVLALGAAGLGLGLPARGRAASTSLILSPTSIGIQSTF
jgi:sulfur carrier protein ThiS